jgi:transposase
MKPGEISWSLSEPKTTWNENENCCVRLTETERKRLLEITKKGNHPARQIVRANILLQLDESDPARSIAEQEAIAERCGCQAGLVYRVGKQYDQEGRERVLNRKQRETPPVPPIVTGAAEAKIIALCCGEPPAGYSRWTLRLLGSQAVELGIVEHLSAAAVGRILQKTHISPI